LKAELRAESGTNPWPICAPARYSAITIFVEGIGGGGSVMVGARAESGFQARGPALRR
jgi:hypothetical protein